MTSENGHNGATPRTEPDWSIARVAAAERVATAIVVAFEVCEEARVPLSQLQKIALIEATLLEFDGLDAQLAELASVAGLLQTLRTGASDN